MSEEIELDAEQQIAELQATVDQLSAERQQLFNHPAVRALRGIRNIRNGNARLGLRDLKASASQVIRRRPFAKPKLRRVPARPARGNPFALGAVDFVGPELFYFDEWQRRPSIVLGSRSSTRNLDVVATATLSNWRDVMALHPKSRVHVNLLDEGLTGTSWEGLFTLDNMRLFREFTLLVRYARNFHSVVEVHYDSLAAFPLARQLDGVLLVERDHV